jgi:hypothetical protein
MPVLISAQISNACKPAGKEVMLVFCTLKMARSPIFSIVEAFLRLPVYHNRNGLS